MAKKLIRMWVKPETKAKVCKKKADHPDKSLADILEGMLKEDQPKNVKFPPPL